MIGFATWWRWTGGVLTAVVVGLLAFGPSLDLMVCGGEGSFAASRAPAAMAVATATPDDSHAGVSQHGDHDGVCPHGHCHHGVAYDAAPSPAAVAPRALAMRLPIPRTGLPTADPRYSLDRPPRA